MQNPLSYLWWLWKLSGSRLRDDLLCSPVWETERMVWSLVLRQSTWADTAQADGRSVKFFLLPFVPRPSASCIRRPWWGRIACPATDPALLIWRHAYTQSWSLTWAPSSTCAHIVNLQHGGPYSFSSSSSPSQDGLPELALQPLLIRMLLLYQHQLLPQRPLQVVTSSEW